MNTNLMHVDIAARTGIDEPMIERLVCAFYGRVREDDLLGPVFAMRIDDWDKHLVRMCAFWSSVALASGRYEGNPMAKHIHLPIDAVHFDRWLEIFETTACESCPPAAAAHFIDRARRIARSLELGAALHAGVLPARGARFHRFGTPSSGGERT